MAQENVSTYKPAPRKVDILLMDQMEAEDALNTFAKYRSRLDQFFEDNHNKGTDNFMGITHYHIMDIVKRDVANAMMRKLPKVYGDGRTLYCVLFINALLPLWIVRLLMDTFNISTEEEAVQQIKDQLEYGHYMNTINNVPLEPDLQELEDTLFQ
ncbi:uncharacterized protein CG4951-like [Drosophila guanche]|uniref:Blast:Uncharacterized protein CG4951 n=1 Tax=Drosophila guanche TaxID=7266 RepID=A0A3B0JY31_DROGU|nr:uncharacterized protein CG4951-like [Drosophila guanche]SPP78266.1 blast:Uncharacterized protein CG4951 [Drosophila guanche]